MVNFLKQFVAGGLLSERIYSASKDEDHPDNNDDEDASNPTTAYGDAKIDPALDQIVPDEVALQAGVPDEANQSLGVEEDEEEQPDDSYGNVDSSQWQDGEAADGEPSGLETDESEGDGSDPGEPQGGGDIEGDASQELGAEDADTVQSGLDVGHFAETLCHMLDTDCHFVSRLIDNKSAFASKYGDDKLPILNEVVHKLTTARDMLAGVCGLVADEGGEDESEVEDDQSLEAPDAAPDLDEDESDNSDGCTTYDDATDTCLDDPEEKVALESKAHKKAKKT